MTYLGTDSQIGHDAEKSSPPIHLGEILLEEFLTPMGICEYRLSKEIGVPQRRIGEIVSGNRAITADIALRLAAFFGTDAQSWIKLRSRYDSETAQATMVDVLSKIHRWDKAPA